MFCYIFYFYVLYNFIMIYEKIKLPKELGDSPIREDATWGIKDAKLENMIHVLGTRGPKSEMMLQRHSPIRENDTKWDNHRRYMVSRKKYGFFFLQLPQFKALLVSFHESHSISIKKHRKLKTLVIIQWKKNLSVFF